MKAEKIEKNLFFRQRYDTVAANSNEETTMKLLKNLQLAAKRPSIFGALTLYPQLPVPDSSLEAVEKDLDKIWMDVADSVYSASQDEIARRPPRS